METHDIGKTYVHGVRLLWNAPPYHRAPTVELDEPYRVGRSHVIHFWPTTLGLSFGRWHLDDMPLFDEHGDPRERDESDAVADAAGLVRQRWFPKKIESIEVVLVRGKPVVTKAPKYALVGPTMIWQIPRWRNHWGVLKIGKYRYGIRGQRASDFTWEIERIDRRGPIKFLFGGNSLWQG